MTSKIERLFTDRERELELFAQMVRREIPGKRVLAIEAPSGIGKSWLTDRYENWCRHEGVPSVRLDFDPVREGGPLSPEYILAKASDAMGEMSVSDQETFIHLHIEIAGGPASVSVGESAIISGAHFGDIANLIVKEIRLPPVNVDMLTRRHWATRRFHSALTACGPNPAVWLVDTCDRATENMETANWLTGEVLNRIACDDSIPLVMVMSGRSLLHIKPEWEGCIKHISLPPFDEKQTHILACERIGAKLTFDMVSFLYRVSGGVPQDIVGLVENYLRAQEVTR